MPTSAALLRPTARLLLLCCMLTTPAHGSVRQCMHEGVTTYSDHLCRDSAPVTLAPLTSLPATPAAPLPAPPARLQRRERGPAAAWRPGPGARGNRRCDKLTLQQRWAREDLERAQGMALLPGQPQRRKAQRRLERLQQQWRAHCGPER